MDSNREPNPAVSESNTHGLSRRRFLKTAAVVMAAVSAGKILSLLPDRERIGNDSGFLRDRRVPSYEEFYLPTNPERILPREMSDLLYDKLDLKERHPSTLNKDAFFSISQRITRLASLYFHPDGNQTIASQEASFYKFNEAFFQKILQISDNLDVDFVGTLLMWQVSGTNTSSVKALRQDVADERIRVGLDIVKDITGISGGATLVKTIRILNSLKEDAISSWYYPMPRVEGPVSLGIHDIETIMISRALKDLKLSLPNHWPEIASYLEKRCPRFFTQSDKYVDLYNDFEKLSNKIADEVSGSQDIQAYLQQFYSPSRLKAFLTDGDEVDAYQFIRTTVFWAKVNERNSGTVYAGGYQTTPKIIEQQALYEAIDFYLKPDNPTAFFLDQIENPKMIKQLSWDSEKGNPTARQLLGKCKELVESGNQIIAADRAIAVAIAAEKLEDDLDFQILTGVAHSRWLLRDTYERTHAQATKKIAFDNPHEMAFHAFLATANREAAPSYQLAGVRPLDRATLTFAPLEVTYQTMFDFIEKAYRKFEPNHPQKDFKKFVRHMVALFEKPIFNRLTGTDRYSLEDDLKMGEFVKKAEGFGVYKYIFTPPHSSWQRSLEATVGYISEITKQKAAV